MKNNKNIKISISDRISLRDSLRIRQKRKGFKMKEGKQVFDLIYKQAFSLYKDFVPIYN